ncbi:thioredoxin-like protein [Gigaspora rosea]|uniref:Thioredoxin-like protein n=1 Tax=Gigaspora rosea TaxID=44941 RepID=A0A397TX59_9GLOM|nr:thioredoxin-like protein [Gigaspora rosea]
MILSLFVTIFTVLVTGVLGSEVISLDSSNFNLLVSKGTWFVDFFAPWCPHCQVLEPIWTKLAAEYGDDLKSKDFYLGKVDCTLNGDFCNLHEVTGYPTLNLYKNGVKIDGYLKSRDFDSLSEYIKNKSEEGYESKTPNDNTDILIVPDDEDFIPPNPSGTVISLNSENFDELTKYGPWFVKFFAPWCGHCKNLAPTWEELSRKLQNKVNVGEVDCTTEKDICSKFNIQGYPTLKLIKGADDITDYKGSRQLQSLQEFAEQAASARLLEVTLDEFDKAKKIDDVFFIYLYDEKTPSKNLDIMKGLSRSFFSIKFYSSKDPKLVSSLKVYTLPALVVIKDDLQNSYQSTNSVDPFDDLESLKNWVQSEKYPLVPAVDSENYEEILGGDRLVVLGLLRPADVRPFIKAKNSLKAIARLYHQQIKKSGGSDGSRGVIFAWLDGDKWENYIYNVYGLNRKDLPTVIIYDPLSSEYFDTSKSGEKFTLSHQTRLLESVNDAKLGYLEGKSTIGFTEKIFRVI